MITCTCRVTYPFDHSLIQFVTHFILLRYLGNFLMGNLLEVRFFESILAELASISPIK